MKARSYAAAIAILMLTGCNEEELKTLNAQNEKLQDEVEELRSNSESLQSYKTGLTDLQAEISNLKAAMKKDYVPKAELDAQSDKLEAANTKMEVNQSDHAVALEKIESLEQQKKDLTTRLDDLINGAERLFAAAEKEFTDKNYESAKETITTLLEKHPDYSANKKVVELAEKIAEQKALADTGDWRVGFLVDEFGENTSEGYVAASFLASMDNSAVQGARSLVSIRAQKDSILFLLYPYGNDSHQTWFRSEYWTWRVQDREKKRHTLRGVTGRSAMLFKRVGSTSYTALQALLMKGGELKFVGSHDRDSWSFTIPNADGYKKAWETMMAADKP